MSTVKLKGNALGAGSVTIESPNTASDRVVTLPDADGNFVIDGQSNVSFAGDFTVDTDTLHVDSTNNRVGVGTTSPAYALDIESAVSNYVRVTRTGTTQLFMGCTNGITEFYSRNASTGAVPMTFNVGTSEAMRIDSSGNVLVNTTSTSIDDAGFKALANNAVSCTRSGTPLFVSRLGSDGDLIFLKKDGTTVGSIGTIAGDLTIGDGDIGLRFDTGTGYVPWNMSTNLARDAAIDLGASTARFKDLYLSGSLFVGSSVSSPETSTTTEQARYTQSYASIARSGATVLYLNRMTNDGQIVALNQAGVTEGNISVSGTTVSFNGGHLSRWSRLPDGTDGTNIYKGTVMTNLNEKIVWLDEEGNPEDNEQLNYTTVSSVEGDKNVAGIFVAWDESDEWGDYYLAQTGDLIIRIAQGVTVERGDLLISAGDGTAKAQADDLVRSSTIAKVISTEVTCTYPDGSYCVPCVVMGC